MYTYKHTLSLSERMHDVYVHRTVGGVEKCWPSLSREPIRLLHAHVIPVRPVHPLLKNCQRKDMWNCSFQNRVAILTIGIGISGQWKIRSQVIFMLQWFHLSLCRSLSSSLSLSIFLTHSRSSDELSWVIAIATMWCNAILSWGFSCTVQLKATLFKIQISFKLTL